MARTGRPRIQIDKDQFEKLCGLLCTEEEIAEFFNCSVDTVNRFCIRTYKKTFAEAYKKLSMAGKISIRRNQLALSKKSAAMAIWLGKQYLNQREAIEYEDKEALNRLDGILDGLRDQAERKAE